MPRSRILPPPLPSSSSLQPKISSSFSSSFLLSFVSLAVPRLPFIASQISYCAPFLSSSCSITETTSIPALDISQFRFSWKKTKEESRDRSIPYYSDHHDEGITNKSSAVNSPRFAILHTARVTMQTHESSPDRALDLH